MGSAGKKASFVGFLAVIGQNDWGQNDTKAESRKRSADYAGDGKMRKGLLVLGGLCIVSKIPSLEEAVFTTQRQAQLLDSL